MRRKSNCAPLERLDLVVVQRHVWPRYCGAVALLPWELRRVCWQCERCPQLRHRQDGSFHCEIYMQPFREPGLHGRRGSATPHVVTAGPCARGPARATAASVLAAIEPRRPVHLVRGCVPSLVCAAELPLSVTSCPQRPPRLTHRYTVGLGSLGRVELCRSAVRRAAVANPDLCWDVWRVQRQQHWRICSHMHWLRCKLLFSCGELTSALRTD